MAQSISTIAQCLEIKNIASEVSNDKKKKIKMKNITIFTPKINVLESENSSEIFFVDF
mgnify:CR=1 FL=1